MPLLRPQISGLYEFRDHLVSSNRVTKRRRVPHGLPSLKLMAAHAVLLTSGTPSAEVRRAWGLRQHRWSGDYLAASGAIGSCAVRRLQRGRGLTLHAMRNYRSVVSFCMWSPSRRGWCIQDGSGRCLAHCDAVHGQDIDAQTAVKLAKAMIRDGRIPCPEDDHDQLAERLRVTAWASPCSPSANRWRYWHRGSRRKAHIRSAASDRAFRSVAGASPGPWRWRAVGILISVKSLVSHSHTIRTLLLRLALCFPLF